MVQCGDLIEISRGLYQHWAIFVGNGYVVHLVPTSEHGSSGASSLMSVGRYRARVKREKLEDVAGINYRINNHLDKKLRPRPIQDILHNANSLVGREVPYHLTDFNCEHFVTLLRYRVPHSQQVEDAMDAMDATTFVVLTLAAAAFGLAILRNEEKENNKHGKRKK